MIQPRNKRIKLTSESGVVQTPQVKKSNPRRGALRYLLEMPMEILQEVLYGLRPLDLLRVSRINKEFRTLLMHRNSAYIWKESRRNVLGLPGPFPGMSEPAFASLCFDTFCHVCARPRVRKIHWEFQMKLCSSCEKSETSPRWPSMNVAPRQYRPLLLPHMSLTVYSASSGTNLIVLKSEAARMKCAWEKTTNGKERSMFMKEHAASINELKKHVIRCKEWISDVKNGHAEEAGIIRNQRYQEICKRLEALGYADDVAYAEGHLQGLTEIPETREAKPLTEQVWEEIQQEVVGYLNDTVHPYRILEERRAFFEPYIPFLLEAHATLARSHCNVFPHSGCFAQFSEVKAILTSPDPGADNISMKHFNSLVSALPEILANWEMSIRKRLNKRVRRSLLDLPSEIPVRDLAIAHFLRCVYCDQIVQNTDIKPAIHDCTHSTYAIRQTYTYDNDPYVKVLGDWGAKSWDETTYDVMERFVHPVLQACHKDRLVTVRELDQFNPRFTCIVCCGKTGIRTVYCWRDAVMHAILCHNPRASGALPFLKPNDWSPVPRHEIQKLARLEQAAEEYAITQKNKQPIWWCRHCDTQGLTHNGVVEHVKDRHGITDPSNNKDFFPTPSLPMAVTYGVIVVPDRFKRNPDTLPESIKMALATGCAAYRRDLRF